METIPRREYRIRPELRRCCWYVLFSVPPLMALFYGVARFAQNRAPADIAIGCAFFALLEAAVTLPLRWKLRVDGEGVSRRLPYRWDLWRWADLASGRVCKRYPYTLYDPERPWWKRWLRLGHMDPAEIQEVFAEINAHYQLPPPPEVPETLAIKYGFRRSVSLDRKGVHLLVRGVPHEYLWQEVRNVHITRMDPLRRDFASLVITLPDQEIELKFVTTEYGTFSSWQNASAEAVNECLFRYLPPERIDVSLAGKPLEKREHIERRLNFAKRTFRELAIGMGVCLPLLVAVLVWMAVVNGILKAIVMAGITAILYGPVMVFVYRQHQKHIKELSRELGDAIGKE